MREDLEALRRSIADQGEWMEGQLDICMKQLQLRFPAENLTKVTLQTKGEKYVPRLDRKGIRMWQDALYWMGAIRQSEWMLREIYRLIDEGY